MSFTAQYLSELPQVNSVLDVACGLNPLAIPWMPLQPGAQYHACDIYTDMIRFIQAFTDLLPVKGVAKVCDVSAALPSQKVDLALVLKTIPCLEQIDKNAGQRLLDGLQAKYLLVSFPAKSLGGRNKGMLEIMKSASTSSSKVAAGRCSASPSKPSWHFWWKPRL